MEKIKVANGVEYYFGEEMEVVMVAPKTIDRYQRLCDVNKKDNLDFDSCGLFWALSDDEFEIGLAKIKKQGLYKEGDKLVRIYGNGFLPKKLVPKLKEMLADNRKKKSDCDPQEVYFYEYNNYECMYGFDGDEPAYNIVVDIFGKEKAKTIKRI